MEHTAGDSENWGRIETIPTTPTDSGEPASLPERRKRKPGGGRRPVLDDSKKREICALIANGASIWRAAQYVGCSVRTIRRIAHHDPEFDQRVRSSFLSAELDPLRALRAAALKNWRAAAWYLERSDPHQFGRKSPKMIHIDHMQEIVDEMVGVIESTIDDPVMRERVHEEMHKFTTRQWLERKAEMPTPTRR